MAMRRTAELPMRVVAPVIVVVLALLAGIAWWHAGAAAQDMTFETSKAAIVTDRGKFDFSIELALTPEEQAHGLMFRKYLPPAAGMLFDFHEDRVVTMWMKNTPIPLDMIFIDAGGTVVGIAENTEPFSLRNVSSGAPARAVLEVNGGTARRIGAKAGDRVLHPMFDGS